MPATVDMGGVLIRELEWGEMNVALEHFPAGAVTAPLFKGLPGDRCQCPHWGYLLKGSMRVFYKDHEEVIHAGDAYYLAPGHTTAFDEETEVVEFSPTEDMARTMAVVARNMAAAAPPA